MTVHLTSLASANIDSAIFSMKNMCAQVLAELMQFAPTEGTFRGSAQKDIILTIVQKGKFYYALKCFNKTLAS